MIHGESERRRNKLKESGRDRGQGAVEGTGGGGGQLEIWLESCQAELSLDKESALSTTVVAVVEGIAINACGLAVMFINYL